MGDNVCDNGNDSQNFTVDEKVSIPNSFHFDQWRQRNPEIGIVLVIPAMSTSH